MHIYIYIYMCLFGAARRAGRMLGREPRSSGFQTGSGQTGLLRSAINSHNNVIITP